MKLKLIIWVLCLIAVAFIVGFIRTKKAQHMSGAAQNVCEVLKSKSVKVAQIRGFSVHNNELIEIFCNLAQIPSPSLSEDKVIRWIEDYCKKNHLKYSLDDYENVYIKVEATDKTKKPLLLSAHMDVVGDGSPVVLKTEGDFIQTDGKRTLGADDKVGVACALLLASELTNNNSIKHGGLEIVLTRDEEHGMTGIKHAEFKKFNSKHILVLDADKLGQLEVSGASYTLATLKVSTPYGGHSGIDIHDTKRLNAAVMISELITQIPQGVFYKDKTGTITSINLGTVIGGNIQNTANKIATDKVKSDDYLDYFIENSVTNVINTKAEASYSIRSADVKKENELKALIKAKVADFNKKYARLAKAEITFTEHLPPFEKANDDLIEKVYLKACAKEGIKPSISSFHAGAETHIYAQNTNANGEKFLPVLLGCADIYNMHSNSEKVNYKSILKGYALLKQVFIEFNR